jgi:signal transduction histidine kinase
VVKISWRQKMKKDLKQMKKWAAFNPVNFAHFAALMEAEVASITGYHEEALKWYDKAVKLSIDHQWLNDQALACELAAGHCFRNGLYVQGVFFANQSIAAYKAWGALQKADKLQNAFRPYLGLAALASNPPTEKKSASLDNVSSGSDNLDLSSIIRTSQAISGEIVLEALLRKMIGIITMNAGAERGIFIQYTDGNLLVQASFVDESVAVMQNIPLREYTHLPHSIINYVLHLKEPIVLNDAAKSGEFTRDTYIVEHNIKSVLCSPVILLNNVYGVIYLENNKLTGAFTQDRLVVLGLLSSQMAISIHNAILYGRLEEKVAERTNELSQSIKMLKATQSQLIQSEKMASLGELSAGIAHEIKNPLNFINNFSELNAELAEELMSLIKEGDTDEALVLAQDIIENERKISSHGKRADSIIKGMLSHSRGSTGKKEPINLNALVEEYLRLTFHGHKARDRSFDAYFKFQPDATIPEVSVVPQEIGQVLINLFNNAFYAVREKQKKLNGGYQAMVIVTTKFDRKMATITVQDNGSGIPENIRDKIFQPFFTTKPTGEGTGLGLSLSYDIIKAHGGDMSLLSEEGEGTEFFIKLPVE